MIAIKNWFLEKNHLRGLRGVELNLEKETDKAVLVSFTIDGTKDKQWIPKSVIIDEWEKDTSSFGYHDYLVDVYHKAYDEGIIENYTIKSGRNVYRGDNFIYQWTTKELETSLKKHGVNYMSRKEWNER